jgi:hypothetical protein
LVQRSRVTCEAHVDHAPGPLPDHESSWRDDQRDQRNDDSRSIGRDEGPQQGQVAQALQAGDGR